LCEISVDAPVAHGVGVGHRVASDARTAKTQMIQFGGLRSQTRFNVAQALAPCQLREGQTAKLIEAGEMLHLVLAAIAGRATAKHMPRQMIHHLREYVLPVVHGAPS